MYSSKEPSRKARILHALNSDLDSKATSRFYSRQGAKSRKNLNDALSRKPESIIVDKYKYGVTDEELDKKLCENETHINDVVPERGIVDGFLKYRTVKKEEKEMEKKKKLVGFCIRNRELKRLGSRRKMLDSKKIKIDQLDQDITKAWSTELMECGDNDTCVKRVDKRYDILQGGAKRKTRKRNKRGSQKRL